MNIDIEIWVYVLLGCSLVALAVALWAIAPWSKVARLKISERPAETPLQEESGLPSLTVVVYTEADEEEIDRCVLALAEQDYPRLQIVIVTRATAGNCEVIAARYNDRPNVYVTFIPPGSHNLSERKLAITLGLKAAEGDVVLTTTSNIRPASPHWLSDMMEPFTNPHIEIALGYSRMDFADFHGPSKWYRQFDSLLTAGQWIGTALLGMPYRGDGYNLAFRKSTFFAHKGYAKNIFLHYGDDDLFVHQIAGAHNTRVVVTPDSILTTGWPHGADRAWTMRKARYMFTARWLPKTPFVRLGLLSGANWLTLAAGIAAGWLAWAAWWPALATLLIWILLQTVQIACYRGMAGRLGAVRLWWAIPIFALIHPLVNFIFRLENQHLRKSSYTWQR